MGVIIPGYDPEGVFPTRIKLDFGAFCHSLNVFEERRREGLELYPVPVKRIGSGEYAAIDGQKRLVIAFLKKLNVNLYHARGRFDVLRFNDFPDVPVSAINGMNANILGKFNNVERYLAQTRTAGVRNIKELVEANKEMIDSAWIKILGESIESIPVVTV